MPNYNGAVPLLSGEDEISSRYRIGDDGRLFIAPDQAQQQKIDLLNPTLTAANQQRPARTQERPMGMGGSRPTERKLTPEEMKAKADAMLEEIRRNTADIPNQRSAVDKTPEWLYRYAKENGLTQ